MGNPSRLAAVAAAAPPALAGTEPPLPVAQMAAAFQQTVADVLVGKTLQAAEDFGARDEHTRVWNDTIEAAMARFTV